jgi:hypothetical protein
MSGDGLQEFMLNGVFLVQETAGSSRSLSSRVLSANADVPSWAHFSSNHFQLTNGQIGIKDKPQYLVPCNVEGSSEISQKLRMKPIEIKIDDNHNAVIIFTPSVEVAQLGVSL